MNTEEIKKALEEGKSALGIEFGSTRIKAVLVTNDNVPVAAGSHEWENRLENNIWTYSLEDIWKGLQDAYAQMAADVKEKYLGLAMDLIAVILKAINHRHLTARQDLLLSCDDHGYFTLHNTVDFYISVKVEVISITYILLSDKTGGFVTFNLILSFCSICHAKPPEYNLSPHYKIPHGKAAQNVT